MFVQALTVLEDSISRDFLSAKYETTHDTSSTCKVIGSADDSSSRIESVSVLPWIPLTTPAVALRLMELDASIYYSPQRKEACETDENGHINVSSHFYLLSIGLAVANSPNSMG